MGTKLDLHCEMSPLRPGASTCDDRCPGFFGAARCRALRNG